MTTDDPGGPARHGLAPPKRSPFTGDRDHPGRGEREVERGGPSAVDEDEGREQVREHAVEPGPGTAHTRAQRPAPGRREDALCAAVRADDQEQGLVVAALQALDGVARHVIALDDDRIEGIAERGGDGDLRAGFDLHMVDERADDTVDAADDRRSARGRVRGVEGRQQRVGPRAPSRRFGFGLAQPRVGVVQLLFRGAPFLRLQGHLGRDLGMRVELGTDAGGFVFGGLRLGHLRRERVQIARDGRELFADFGELRRDCGFALLELREIALRVVVRGFGVGG